MVATTTGTRFDLRYREGFCLVPDIPSAPTRGLHVCVGVCVEVDHAANRFHMQSTVLQRSVECSRMEPHLQRKHEWVASLERW
jgi:hypothetical protein